MVRRGILSQQRFKHLVTRALARPLPEEFRSRLENVAVLIEDKPLEDMPDTLGTYEGVPCTERSPDKYNLARPDNAI